VQLAGVPSDVVTVGVGLECCRTVVVTAHAAIKQDVSVTGVTTRRQLVGMKRFGAHPALRAVVGFQVVAVESPLVMRAEGFQVRMPAAVPFSIRVERVGVRRTQQASAALGSRVLVLARPRRVAW
jgi:hypothetical protein